MFCKNCGAKVSDDILFCPSCGMNLKGEDVDQEIKEEVETINTSTYKVKLNNMIISVFDEKGDNINLAQYYYGLSMKPKKLIEFNKKNVSEIKFKRGIYPRLISKLRVIICCTLLIVTLIFPLLLLFDALYAPVVFFLDTQKYMLISLKNGEKIKVYYSIKEEAQSVANMLVETN